MSDYDSVLQLVKELNQQVQLFETLKSEHERRVKEFTKKEENFSKLAEEAAGTLGAVAGLLCPTSDLHLHLLSLKDAFSDLSQRAAPEPENDAVREEGSKELEEVETFKDHGLCGSVEGKVDELQEDPITGDQEIVLTAAFPQANHVELALAPWNWSSVPMIRCEDAWQTSARLPSGGGVQFKFIVDGEWKCSEQYPTVKDNLFENNYIDCM